MARAPSTTSGKRKPIKTALRVVPEGRAAVTKSKEGMVAMEAKIARLRKRTASQKEKLDQRGAAIEDLESKLREKDGLLNKMNLVLTKVTEQRDRLFLLLKEAQDRNDARIAEISGEDDRGGGGSSHRSFARDSLSIVQEQARTSVETTLNNVRAKLRTPPKIKPSK